MRRRFVFDKATGRIMEVAVADRVPEAKVHIQTDTEYDGLRSTDGVDLSTRKRHRQYMKDRGYAMMSDFTSEWAKAEERRKDYLTTGGDHDERKKAIEEALDAVTRKKYKPKRYSGEGYAVMNEEAE